MKVNSTSGSVSIRLVQLIYPTSKFKGKYNRAYASDTFPINNTRLTYLPALKNKLNPK